MTSYTELLTPSVLIKDFSYFTEKDWLLFGDYDQATLKNLMRDRHSIQACWDTTTKFWLDSLRISFCYENESDCVIIEASRSYPLEGNKLLLTTRIELEQCLIDRSFYNNHVQISMTDEDYKIVTLYKRIFHGDRRYEHRLRKNEFLEIDNNNKIYYILQYNYSDTTLINTAMGLKKFSNDVASTGEDNFRTDLIKMLEDKYTKPLLNKELHELTDDDILVLQMHNT